MKFSKILMIFIFVEINLFTICMIWMHYYMGSTPDTVAACVYSFFGAECGFMSVIKSTEEKYYERKIALEDREYEETKGKESKTQEETKKVVTSEPEFTALHRESGLEEGEKI